MDKALGLVGLAKRAGKIAAGEGAVKDSIRFGKAYAVIIASDASDNTRKNITDSCKYYEVPYYIAYTKDILGHAIGNNFNAAIAVLDKGFCENIEKYLQQSIDGGDKL